MISPLQALAAGLAWEAAWWARRRHRRTTQYAAAQQRAIALRRPLVVIGAPDGGVTSGYGCGDITLDIAPSRCPNAMQVDVTNGLPFPDNTVVVLCVCTLEYVHDANAAIAEIQRVTGGHAFYVGVEPWTAASVLYPGAKRTLPSRFR